MMGIDLSFFSFCWCSCMAFPGCLFLRVGNTMGQRSDVSTVNGKAERNAVDAQTVGLSVWELPWERVCVTLCCLKRVFHRALLYLIYCAVCTLDSASDRWPNTEGDAAPTAALSHSSADTHVTECTQTLVCSAG